MMNTFWMLLAFAVAMTFFALKYRNFMLSFSAVIGWTAIWAYNASNPPTNVAQGSFVHELIMYGALVMGVGVGFVYYRNRQRGYTGYTPFKWEEKEMEAKYEAKNTRSRGMMEMGVEEYKEQLHNRLARRRR